MSKFWTVHGDLRKDFEKLFAEQKAVEGLMQKFAKKCGAIHYGIARTAFGVHFSLQYKDESKVDNTLFKKVKGSDGFFVPRRTSKASRALDEELEKLSRAMPSNMEYAKLLGFVVWDGEGYAHRVGVGEYAGSLVVMTNDKYFPKEKVAKNLKRISDLHYEKLLKKARAKS